MPHQQLVAALSRGFADIEAHEYRRFDFEVTAGRFEMLDLSHRLLLVFFANGEPAEPQGTLVQLESGRFLVHRMRGRLVFGAYLGDRLRRLSHRLRSPRREMTRFLVRSNQTAGHPAGYVPS